MELDRAVFQDSSSSVFINKNYLAIKVNGQKGEGRDLCEKYQIRGYPTVLLVDPDANEIDRICGWNNDKKAYFASLVDYTNGRNTIEDLMFQIAKDSMNAHMHYRMAKKYTDRWELEKAKVYFERVLQLDHEDRLGYAEESRGYLATQHLYETGDDSPLRDLLRQTANKEYINKGYQVLIRYFKSHKISDKVIDTYESALDRLDDDSNLMNDYAWYIYENKLKDRYENAIDCAKKALSLRPESANIWDTLAWLAYESGERDSAIVHMRTAVNLAPEEEYFQKNLNHFLKAE